MEEKKKNNITYLIPAILLALIVGIVVFLIFGMKGETKSTGNAPEDEVSESVSCTAKDLEYPFFDYDHAGSKTTKITMIFKGDKLASIYLAQEMTYNDAETAAISETRNHISMNKSFSNTYGADAFNANYNVSDTKMRMSLYTDAASLNEDAKKYFLATGTTNSKNVLTKNYESQGFSCIISNN